MSSRRRRRNTSTSAPGITLIGHTALGANNTFTTPTFNSTGSSILIVGLSYKFGTAPALSDSKGNTGWVGLTPKQSANFGYSQIYYKANPAVGAAHSLTVTGANMLCSAVFCGFSGILLASPFDKESVAFTGGPINDLQPGSLTPTLAGSLVITHLDWESQSNIPTINSGFTLIDSYNVGAGVGSDYGSALGFIVGAGPYNPTWHLTNADYAATTMGAFKHA